MLSGLLPFNGTTDSEIEDAIKSLDYDFEDDDGAWDGKSEEIKDLISKILSYEKYRITPKEAMNHPWMKKILGPHHAPSYHGSFVDKFEDFKESNQLKKAILSFLATKVNDDEITQEIELFNSFDSNNDGYITQKELK